MVIHWIVFVASLLAAAGVYLFLLSNWLIGIQERPWKIPLILILPVLLLAIFGWLGWFQVNSAWLLILSGIITWLIYSWIKEARDQKKLQASQPVLVEPFNQDPPQSSIREILKRVSLNITTTDLQLACYRVVIPDWRGPRVRVAQASDFHINAALPANFFRGVVQAVNEQSPDLVLLPGDFVSHDGNEELLPDLLGGFQSKWGVYGILGNHDYWLGKEATSQLVSQAGIELIGDGARRIKVHDGASTGDVLLFGCEYPWNGKSSPLGPDWPAIQPVDLSLVLSHTPDNFFALQPQGFNAIFSGHLHAGQFRLPALGAIAVPSQYGKRLAHGHYLVGETHLFVTAGIGAMVPSLRLNCPPDIFVIDFVGQNQ